MKHSVISNQCSVTEATVSPPQLRRSDRPQLHRSDIFIVTDTQEPQSPGGAACSPSCALCQRDCITQPRVARNGLPWVPICGVNNPERVAASVSLTFLGQTKLAPCRFMAGN